MNKAKSLIVIGLNSGTSMDGIDAAIFRLFFKKPEVGVKFGHTPGIGAEVIQTALVPFDKTFLKKLQKTVVDGPSDWREVTLLNATLGEIFADAAIKVTRDAGLSLSEIDLIGSHGQTIWHAPDSSPFWGTTARGTLQLGELAVIAARTNVTVVGDFRPGDIAEGGQGAPLVPFADEVLFGGDGIASGVLNLGGIANITILSKDGIAELAFDTGPANMIMDRVTQQLFGAEYDKAGALARSGKINEAWLSELLSHPYYSRRPPKTTGRELFGHQFADNVIAESRQRKVSKEDLLATVTALTARSIADAYKNHVLDKIQIERMILGGGGADNTFLIEQLQESCPKEIAFLKHEDLGISAKFKESFLFALLAFTTYLGIPNNVPACTGAKRRVCLGKVVAGKAKRRFL
jgi:anhydro-N-acetylmuramic acid kinase